jgi:serpin B
MVRHALLALSLVAVLAALLSAPAFAARVKGPGAPAAPMPTAQMTRISEANNTFAANLYGKLSGEAGNLFFSPNSIETALIMTMAGAKGKTFDQMGTTLGFPVTEGRSPWPGTFKEAGEFLKELNAEKGADGKLRQFQLSVANALWGQKGHEFLPDFLGLVKDNFGAGFEGLDFQANTEGARKTINAWVEKQTQDKIKDLLKPGVLTADTRLVLTNAIYFKGKWTEQFEKSGTKDEPFHLGGGKDIKAPLMNLQKKFGYKETSDWQAVQLSYAGNELSMIVILPKKADGLAAVEKTITPALLNKDLATFGREEVVLALPKFKTTSEFGLGGTLAALGMKDAFDPGAADFSGMDGKKDLYISAVVHKAFVDVNEEGTEAAAATGVVMTLTAVMEPKEPKVFKADHPFLFLIRHEKTGAVLFMGRIADPTK